MAKTQAARDKLMGLYQKLHIARAQLFLMQQALTNGETDLELLSSDVLDKQCDVLEECEHELYGLANPLPSAPEPPGKRRSAPAALQVVKTGIAA